MASVERPTCEYNGIGGCARPATHMVSFQSRRWRLSCDSHKMKWKGAYWIGSLLGWKPDPAPAQEDSPGADAAAGEEIRSGQSS